MMMIIITIIITTVTLSAARLLPTYDYTHNFEQPCVDLTVIVTTIEQESSHRTADNKAVQQ